jgi:translation elongation factor EF-G
VIFLGLARVLSGTLRPGVKVRVLGPKHSDITDQVMMRRHFVFIAKWLLWLVKMIDDDDDNNNDSEITTLTSDVPTINVGDLYLPMGRHLERLAAAPAGR